MTAQAPAMHALTGPHRYGLTRVKLVFGKPQRVKSDVILSGDLVFDKSTNRVMVFAYLDSDRRPFLITPGAVLEVCTERRARYRLGRLVDALREKHSTT